MDLKTDALQSPASPSNTSDFPEGTFGGLSAYQDRLRRAIREAAARQSAWMLWSDSDFRDWPLGERAVLQDLNEWAGRGRQLRILARQFDDVPRLHPRFVAWRQQWDHIIECRVSGRVPDCGLPSVLLAPQVAVQRTDLERSGGWSGCDRQRLAGLQSDVHDCWQQGRSAFPSTTLGL